MKLGVVGVLLILLALCEGEPERFEESMRVKPLPSGHLYAFFEFVMGQQELSSFSRLFPRSLSEVLEAHAVHELHFTLTQGHWQTESWGQPLESAPGGAQVRAWFTSPNNEKAGENWKGLTSRLSGLTCASLNFLDEKTSMSPHYAYRPQGNILSKKFSDPLFVRVGSLAKEHICTENLTPWSKLLPCGFSRGLASMLRSKQVFNTHYHSAGIHFIETDQGIQLKLTLSLVFEEIDSRYRPTDNFARKMFGQIGIFPCYPAHKTSLEFWSEGEWIPVDYSTLNSLKMADIPQGKWKDLSLVFSPVRYMGGYGQEHGEIIVEMTNHLPTTVLPVLYVEVLPWYIRPYLHTMKVEVKPIGLSLPSEPGQLFHYTPGRDREILHKLEMNLQLPPKSTVTLSFMFEKRHLKWDEYPPDANHGFYLEPAHFEVNYTDDSHPNQHYYSRKLLVNLSTPDFSMPYNVICLTCTVVALAFGPIHNITTKSLRLKVIVSKKEAFKKLLDKFLKRKPSPVLDNAVADSEVPENSSGVNEPENEELPDEGLSSTTPKSPESESPVKRRKASKRKADS